MENWAPVFSSQDTGFGIKDVRFGICDIVIDVGDCVFRFVMECLVHFICDCALIKEVVYFGFWYSVR